MKASNFLEFLNLGEKELVEWTCPKCSAEDLPDEEKKCPSCGYKVPEQLYDDKLRKSWESIYNRVFSRIRGKIFENDLPTANTVRFVNQLSRYGIVRRLRNGRIAELLNIPKDAVIQCFVESDMKKLWRMAYSRKKTRMKKEQIRAQRYQFI